MTNYLFISEAFPQLLPSLNSAGKASNLPFFRPISFCVFSKYPYSSY